MSARNIENRFPLPNQQQRLKEDKDMRYMKDKFGAIPKDHSLCYICMKQLQVTLFPTPPQPQNILSSPVPAWVEKGTVRLRCLA